MSYQVGDACFDAVGDAAKAVASAAIGHVVPAGGTVYVVDAVGAANGSIAYTLAEVGTAATLTHTATPSYPACVLLGAADAVEAGWLVAGVWIGVWALLAIRRAFV